MSKLKSFVDLAASVPGADYAMVYLEEAHPVEGWMYPAVQHHIRQHAVLSERAAAAQVLEVELRRLTDGCGIAALPIYVDGMANTVSLAFGALPERLAIVLDGRVSWIGGKGPEDYSMEEASRALRKFA